MDEMHAHLPPKSSSRIRRRVTAATIAGVLLLTGGYAAANILDDGAGVDAPASQKIPFIVEDIQDMERELATIPEESTDPSDVAQRAARARLVAGLEAALDRLCLQLQPGETVDGC